MKTFSFIKKSAFGNSHPQEDFFVISKKYPIFVVADGVSLNFDKESDYPKKSGAAEAAKIFCEIVMFEAEKRFDNFTKKDLTEIFDIGNNAVLKYNISCGRTKDAINYYDVDLFSATTAFLLVKGGRAYWWSLCDSGVVLFNDKHKKMFSSPAGWDTFPKNWVENRGDKEKIIVRHRDYRNAVNAKGKRVGYGVVDGEESAKLYLNLGVLDVKNGYVALVHTDGFENYFSLKEFKDLFIRWPKDIVVRLEDVVLKKSEINPSKYGREKTLVAICI